MNSLLNSKWWEYIKLIPLTHYLSAGNYPSKPKKRDCPVTPVTPAGKIEEKMCTVIRQKIPLRITM